MIAAGVRGRARWTGACLLAMAAVLGCGAQISQAAPADRALSFGDDGIAAVASSAGVTSFPAETTARMAIGPQDEIFVLHSNYAPCSPPFNCAIELGVTRYDAAGKRDPAYGIGAGSQLVVRGAALELAFELAVGPDGKPVVIAYDQAEGAFTVARFDHAGHLDGTFGSGGRAFSPIQAGGRAPAAIAVQPDGKVVVAVEGSREGAGSTLQLARYLVNGEPDSGFGSAGKAAMVVPVQSRPGGILLSPDGHISVPSPRCCLAGSGAFGGGFAVARFLSNGSPDLALAGTGQLLFPTPGANGGVEAAALAADGGAFVIFEENTETVSTVGNIIKLRLDGSADPAFGSGGRIRLFTRVGGLDPSGLVVDREGRLVGVGWDGNASVFRLRSNGGTDRTFNGGRYVTAPFGGVPLGVALQSSGRIVFLAESGCCGPRQFALVALRGGTDRTRCLKRKATIVGTRGPDEITGTPWRDVIAALGGKDKVRALSGADLICGGKGRDTLLGGPGRDEVRQ